MSGNSKKTPTEAVRKSLTVTVVEAKGLSTKSADKPHIYCVVSVNNVHYNTSPSDRGQKPEWKQKFTFAEAAIQPKDAQLRVILFNKQGVKDTVIGEADINLSDLLPNQAWKEWHVLGDEKGKAKILLDIHLLTDTPSVQKRKNRMNESLTRRISWGAKQTSSAQVVSPAKKVVEESSSDSEERAPQSGKIEATAAAGGSAEANGSKRRRAATFDFVGTGTDAENYEDQFKQAYHDETDMEDAFATDDAKDPVMDDSDAENDVRPPVAEKDPVTTSEPPKDDSTTKQTVEDPDAPPPTLSEALKASSGTSLLEDVASPNDSAPAASTQEDHSEPKSTTEAAESDHVAATPSKSGKKPSKKKSKSGGKKNKGKPVKPMEALPEEGEDSDSHSVSGTQTAPVVHAPIAAPETPSRKKTSNGFMGFLKRLGGSKGSKHAEDTHASDHETEPAPNAPTAVASPTAVAAATTAPSSAAPVAASPTKEPSPAPVAADPPKTPRGPKAPKVDPYEAMKAELKSYVEMERAFIQDLHTLLDGYLLPAKKLPVPIEHVSVLCAPVEQMITSHSETLKIVEKKSKDDQFAVGTTFDELLAAVSDSYKLYRSKQVLLLTLLDSSPTEKSMADHAAISNWLETLHEEQEDSTAKHPKQLPPLQELVLEPMHRLAGIAFLLEQLSVVTPQVHPDFPNIRKATARVNLLQQELSMRGTTYRSMAKLAEIDAMLEFPYGVPSFQLADESAKRSYLLEGPVYQVEQHPDHAEFSRVYFFLFNDLLLICKQLARDMGTSPTNSTKQGRRNAGSRQNSVVRQSSGVNSTNGQIVQSPANKYIVLSRIMLDRMFLVDPEDAGEMGSFGLAKSKRKNVISHESSAPGGTEGESPQKASRASPPRSKVRAESSSSKTPPKNGEPTLETNDSDDIEELKEVDRLLEVVDMGVSIHRLRFGSRDDKKLWLTTFNSAFTTVKLSFGSNERQYLYKLLLATQPCKPILGESDNLSAWPSSRFVASSATRQLLERMHSHTFATVNLHKSSSPTPPDSDVVLIKQEVANLKREHIRQLAELSVQHEKDQSEIAELQKELKTKEEAIIAQSRQTRSDTLDSVDSNTSASSVKKKKKGANVVDETLLQKYVTRLEARENEMLKRMDAAEASMKLQSEHFLKTVHAMTKEMEEMKKERIVMSLQQDRLSAALERFMSGTPTVSTNGLQRESSSDKPPPGTVAAARESVIRQSSGISVSKPPVPAKPGVGASNAQPVNIVAPVKLGAGGAPPRVSAGGWRGSTGSPSMHAPSVNGSGSASPASGDKPMNPAIATFGSKGKRPSSVSLIAAVPLEQLPPSDGVADSSESSGPRNGPAAASVPNLFGTAGKSPSRLNLGAAQGAAATDKPGPVSPGGRGKERKVKNLRFPNGENEGGKGGNWLQKKLGFSKDKPRREDSSGQIAPSWRQTPSSAGNSSDAPVTVKKANKVDWTQTRAEAYLSDDLGSDYDPAMAMSPSDFERAQEEFMAPDNIGSDYSEEGEH